MKTLLITATTTAKEIEEFCGRRCGRCGYQAHEHLHMFGSEVYLCPTIAQFHEPDDSAWSADWKPEFTVWIVRRGKRFPMIVDSVWVQEELAHRRAALLGIGEGWCAQRYSHLQPAAEVPA